jgi:hypothetical protein
VVLYLSTYAAGGPGDVYVYPADASPDAPETLLPLRDLLEALRDCPARHKLLILNTFRPLASRGGPGTPPGRLGVLNDDVASRIPPALAAVEDPARLVLCACSPGQVTLTSEDMERTVFGYYLDMALRGAADGYGAGSRSDGRVSVAELTAFVRDRVDRWAWENRRTRQTPVLYGSGEDFQLTAVWRGWRRPSPGPPALAPDEDYPGWLLDDWKRLDGWRQDLAYRARPRSFRQLEAVVLRAEEAWRGGQADADVRADRQPFLDRLQAQLEEARLVGKNPQPRSLAVLVAQGHAPDEALVTQVEQLVLQMKRQTQGLAPDKAEPVRAKLIADFSAKLKDRGKPPAPAAPGQAPPAPNQPPPEQAAPGPSAEEPKPGAGAADADLPFHLAWAVCAAARNENRPGPDTIRFLDQLLLEQMPEPRYVETVTLHRLAGLAARTAPADWPVDAVYWLLQVVALGEQAISRPEPFPWLRGLLDEAAQTRYEGEYLFWAHGYAAPEDAAGVLRLAANRFRTALTYEDDLDRVQRALADALAFLPAYAAYVDAVPASEDAWSTAVQEAGQLLEAADPAGRAAPSRVEDELRGPSPANTPADLRLKAVGWRQRAERLQGLLDQLRTPLAGEDLAGLIHRSQAPAAQPPLADELDVLLMVPSLKAADRLAVWRARRQLGRRLLEGTLHADETSAQPAQPSFPGDTADTQQLVRDQRRRAERRARMAQALLGLGGLSAADLGPLNDALQKAANSRGDAGKEDPLDSLGTLVRRAWVQQLSARLQAATGLGARARVGWLFPPFDPNTTLDDTDSNPALQLHAGRARALWAWLAERYRYELRDGGRAAGRAGETPETQTLVSNFFGDLARGFDRLAGQALPAETAIDLSGSGPQPRLTAAEPVANYTLEVRLAGPAAPGGDQTVRLRALADRDWLRVAPFWRGGEVLAGGAEAGILQVPASDLPGTVQLRVALAPGAETLGAPPPQGFVVQAVYQGRSYHALVPVAVLLAPPGPLLALSADPKAPTLPLTDLRIRPVAAPQSFYLYVTNPTSRPYENLTVELAAAGPFSGLTASRVAVGPGKSAPVVFKAPPPPPVVTPPPGAAPPAQPAVAPAPSLPELTGPLRIRLVDADKQGALLDSKEVRVGIAAPSEYVRVTDITFTPPGPQPGGVNNLTARLRATAALTGPACAAELVLPPANLTGLVGQPDGTFRGIVPPDGAPLTLFATNIQFAQGSPREGPVYVNIDRCERALIFRTSFPATGSPTTPQPDSQSAIRLRAAPYARSGPGYKVTVEVDNAPAGATLDLALGRRVDGAFVPEVVKTSPEARPRRVGFSPSGADGALLFDGSIEDWTVALDTGLVLGPRVLRGRLLSRDGGEIRVAYLPVVLQDSAPEQVKFVNPRKLALRGAPLPVQVLGFDSGSGVAQVQFFLGKPVNDAVPPNTATTPAAAVPGSKGLWAAAVPIPADRLGPTDLSVQVTNKAGLSAFATTTVDVVDKLPPVLGQVHVTVTEGPRQQPGLEVVLRDVNAKTPQEGTFKGKTGEDGTYLFTNVPPGNYKVSASKPVAQRKAEREVTVEADKTAEVSLALLL